MEATKKIKKTLEELKAIERVRKKSTRRKK